MIRCQGVCPETPAYPADSERDHKVVVKRGVRLVEVPWLGGRIADTCCVGETIERAAHVRRRRWHAVTLVAVVVIVGLAGSLAVTAAVERAQQRHAGQLMDQHADEVARAVTAEANRYRDPLSDVAAAVGAQSDFTAGDFTQITSRLTRQRLPGATGVAFGVPADSNQAAGVQALWRARGASGLTLTAGEAAREHLFLIFSQPLDGTIPTPGRDLSAAPQAADALRTSRISGQVTASHTYVLLRDRVLPATEQQMSFVLAVPVTGGLGTPDAGQFRGWIVMGMRGGDFMRETLQSQSQDAVSVTLIDQSASTPAIVARLQTSAPARAGTLGRERIVIVGQRRWQLRLEPAGTLLAATDRGMPALAFAIAMLITMLVAAMAGVLAGARDRARDAVDLATAALRDDIRRREAIEAQLREREGELRHLALHDPLTGLANRTLFHERADHAIATHSRSAMTLAVLFIDLDGFKQINDTLGHSAGDTVLIEVAARLRRCVRAGDTVGRFGGDEFAVLTEQVGTIDDATVVADRIIHALRQPFDVEGRAHHLSASAGVALYEQDTSADTVIRCADEAMYAAKATGKGRYVLAPDTGTTTDRAA
jgi:diguanylate cyclase (GGDEF)-like protein